MHKVLIIAGSDSGGGAGLQADLKTLTALGTFGTCAVTAVTAQNTLGVQNTYEIPAHIIARQIDSIMTDIGTDALKTGMLCSANVVKLVSNKIKQYGVANSVIDPVMAAKGGAQLLSPDGVDALVSDLIPSTFLLTPNTLEAERLSGMKIKTLSDMERSAKAIHSLGAENVLVKGGHMLGDGGEEDIVTDVLYDGKHFEHFSSRRIRTKNTHGTGCTYASAIAAGLAMGQDLKGAIRDAKSFITRALRSSFNPGKGHGTLNQLGAMEPVDPGDAD